MMNKIAYTFIGVILLTGCAASTSQYEQMSPEEQELLNQKFMRRFDAEQTLRSGSGATPKQIEEAKAYLDSIAVYMAVLPHHDMETMPKVTDPTTEMFMRDRMQFGCELVSLDGDGMGRYTATLRLQPRSIGSSSTDDLYYVKTIPELITVTSSKLGEIPLKNRYLSVTISPEGQVTMLNSSVELENDSNILNIQKRTDGRYQLTVTDPEKKQKPNSYIVDRMEDCDLSTGPDEFAFSIDYYSLTSDGWVIWNYEKGPGESDLSWLKTKTKTSSQHGAFD